MPESEPVVRGAGSADRRSPGSPAAGDERAVSGGLWVASYRQDKLKMALIKGEERSRFYYNSILV